MSKAAFEAEGTKEDKKVQNVGPLHWFAERKTGIFVEYEPRKDLSSMW